MINNLVSALKEYQNRNRLTTSDLADRIGISGAMVSYIYSGKKKIGDKSIRGIMKIRELIPDCLKFLMEEKE